MLIVAANVCVGATVPYVESFEYPLGPEWSGNMRESDVPDAFSRFAGRYGYTTSLTLTLTNLTVSQTYELLFDLYILDTWDGTAGNDHFALDIQGTNAWDYTFFRTADTNFQTCTWVPTRGPEQMGFSGWEDNIYRDVGATFTATATTATITFRGYALSAASDESWGIDNVRVAVTGTLSTASNRIVSCTVPDHNSTSSVIVSEIHLFAGGPLTTNTATNAANYVLTEAGLDGIPGNGDDVTIGTTPVFNGVDGVRLDLASVPLVPGTYRFAVSNLQLMGSQPVAALTRDFTIVHPGGGKLAAPGNHDRETAEILGGLLESPAGSGIFVGQGAGYIEDGGEDYWRFEAQAGDGIIICAQSDRTGSPRIALQNNAGTVIRSPSYNSTTMSHIYSYTINSAGTYYVRVNDGGTGDFRYRIRITLSREEYILESENNYSQGSADVAALTETGGVWRTRIYGALHQYEYYNVDYWRLDYFGAGCQFVVTPLYPQGSTLPSDALQLTIENDVSGTLLTTNGAPFVWVLSEAGTVYIRASAPDRQDVMADYALDVQILDSVAPSVLSDSLPAQGSTNQLILSAFTIDFSERMDAAAVTDTSNWEMVSAGADNVLDTGDDEPYTLSTSYDDGARRLTVVLTDGPLQTNRIYRFRAFSGVTDLMGNSLSPLFSRQFTIEGVSPFATENRDNGSRALATPLGESEEIPGVTIGLGRGQIGSASDTDYWSFNVQSGQTIVVSARCISEVNSGLYYRLYDPDGGQVAASYSDAQGRLAMAAVSAGKSGAYTVRASQWYGYRGEYRLRVVVMDEGIFEESEGNDTLDAGPLIAMSPTGGVVRATVAGSLGPADPGDVLLVGSVSSGDVVRVTWQVPAYAPGMPLVDLVSSNGTSAIASNNVLRLDGDGDAFIVNPVSLFPTTSLTVEFWMRALDASKSGTPISYAVPGNYDALRLRNYRSLQCKVGTQSYTPGAVLSDGEWHHVAYTWSTNTARGVLYVDGVEVHEQNSLSPAYSFPGGGSLVLGQEQDNVGGGFAANEAFMGEMDDVRIWSYVRSDTQIATNRMTALTGGEPGLIAYWDFDGAFPLDDLTISNNDGALLDNAYVRPQLRPEGGAVTNFEVTITNTGPYYLNVRDAWAHNCLLGSYRIDVEVEDNNAPAVLSVSLPGEGTSTTGIIYQFSVVFSETMEASGLTNSANYLLEGWGDDETWSTSDDEVYALSVSGTGDTAALTVMDGPIQPGELRFTVQDTAEDRSGNSLPADYVRTFTLVRRPDLIHESRGNDTRAGATSLSWNPGTAHDGGFALYESLSMGNRPISLVLAHLNGDPHLDAAVADAEVAQVKILAGVGDGTFVPMTNVPVDSLQRDIVCGDFNNDTNLDLAVTLPTIDRIQVLLGDGAGGFAVQPVIVVGDEPLYMCLTNVVGGADDDLVVGHRTGTEIRIMQGAGDGTFVSATNLDLVGQAFNVEVADVTGDGESDIVVNSQTATRSLVLLEGLGSGAFGPEQLIDSGYQSVALGIADWTGDGTNDVIAGNYYGGNIAFHEIAASNSYTVGGLYRPYGSVVSGDWNGDGLLDAAVAEFSGDKVTVFTNSPTGMVLHVRHAAGVDMTDVAVADINGDGRPDFVATSYGSRRLDVLLGTATEPLVQDPPGSDQWTGMGYGHLREGGDVDWWSFHGEAGDQLSLFTEAYNKIYYSRFYCQVYRPGGASYWVNYVSPVNGKGSLGRQVLPETGRYLLRVAPYNAGYTDEYFIRVCLVRPPRELETENNDSVGGADSLQFTLQDSTRYAYAAGALQAANNRDYFALGNIASGTVLRAYARGNTNWTFDAELEFRNDANQLLTNAASTSLTYTVTESRQFYAVAYVPAGEPYSSFRQYLLDLEVEDTTVPEVTGWTLPEEGSTNWSIFIGFDISFSEAMNESTVTNAGAYSFVGAGADKAFDTGDDVVYTLRAEAPDAVTARLTILDGPVQPGLCRFRATSAVQDLFGSALDPFERTFAMTNYPGWFLEDRDNNAASNGTVMAHTTMENSNRVAFCRGSLEADGDEDWWLFDAEAGDRAVIVAQVTGNASGLKYEIYDEAGTNQIFTQNFGYYGDGQTVGIVLPETGRYAMRVAFNYNYRGEYRVGLHLVPPDITIETESNNDHNNADDPEYIITPGVRSGSVWGVLVENDSSGDYYQLGYVGTNVEIEVNFLRLGDCSTNVVVHIRNQANQVVATMAAGETNVSHTVLTEGYHYARVTSADRGVEAAYELYATVTDSVLPTIGEVTLPAEGSVTSNMVYGFSVDFEDAMNAASATNTTNYVLRGAGSDRAFGTGDDVDVNLAIGVYSFGTPLTFDIVENPLQPGLWRFTASTQLTDTAYNNMASPYVRNFEIVGISGVPMESPTNGTMSGAMLLEFATNAPGWLNSTVRGMVQTTTDQDWYRFDAVSNELVVLSADVLEGWSSACLLVKMYSADGGTLLDSYTPSYGVREQFAPIQIPSNGTYYACVQRYSATGIEYRFRVTRLDPQYDVETEANGAPGSADAVTLVTSGVVHSATSAGYVYKADDKDYFSVGTVTNGQSIVLGVRLPTDSLFLPVVSVYDQDDVYVPELGTPGDAVAEVPIAESNTYHAVVRSAYGAGSETFSDGYLLDIIIAPSGSLNVPNLEVTSVAASPTIGLESGDALDVQYAIENTGKAVTDSGNWNDLVVLSTDHLLGNADDVTLSLVPHVGALAAGEAYTNTLNATIPDGVSGDYYAIVYADYGQHVDENIFESDNQGRTVSSFHIDLAPYPDLAVTNLDTGVSNAVGGTVDVSWAVTNRGTGAVSNNFYESIIVENITEGGTVTNVERLVTNALAAGQGMARSFGFVPVEAGTHRITVTVDSRDDIYEWDGGGHVTAEANAWFIDRPMYLYATVTLATNPPTGGTATGAGVFLAGSTVTVTAQADTAVLPYEFRYWTEGGAFVSSADEYAFVIQNDRTLTAEFGLPMISIVANVQPAGAGLVSGAGSYELDSSVDLTATAGPGYGFTEWRETGVYVTNTPGLSLTAESNRTFTAVFYELNPQHDVTVQTDPTGLVSIAGAGTYTNGESVVLTASNRVDVGDVRYTFKNWRLNGEIAATTSVLNKTFSTLDPSNMLYVATYTSNSIYPLVDSLEFSHESPVPLTTALVMTVTFDRSMDTNITPVLSVSNIESHVVYPVTGTGTWSKGTVEYDTYAAPAFTVGSGMDGTCEVHVASAIDLDAVMMRPAVAGTCVLDATIPTNPVVVAVGSVVGSQEFAWTNYTAPSDLAGFRLFNEPSAFTNAAGLPARGYVAGSAQGTVVGGIQPDQDYHIAIAAVDEAGNCNLAVTSILVRQDSVLPPAVDLTLNTIGTDDVEVRWDGYDTATLVGFDEFRFYHRTTNFGSVAAMTPDAVLGASVRGRTEIDVDRSVSHFFAVVGVNRLGQGITNVVPARWDDPLSLITNDMTLGGADEPVIDVLVPMRVLQDATLTILPGTTLRFADNTGVKIENGALVADGTALRPIRFQSANEQAGTAQPGDWNGVELWADGGSSVLHHVWITYGDGLQVQDCAPDIDAMTIMYNAGAGLDVSGTGTVATTDLLVEYCATGLLSRGSAQLSVSNAIVCNNPVNAAGQSVGVLDCVDAWWGASNATDVVATVTGNVNYAPFLDREPLLTPAAEVVGGVTKVPQRAIEMNVAARLAESVRISEDPAFGDCFFDPFQDVMSFTLSEGAAVKPVYVQFRNVPGQVSGVVTVNVEYVTDGPEIQSFSLADDEVVARPLNVTATATAPLGMAGMTLLLDGTEIAGTNGGTLDYYWDMRAVADGPHVARIEARDTEDALSYVERTIRISRQPPVAPVITDPGSDGMLTTNVVDMTGSAEPNIGVRVMCNGVVIAQLTADAAGVFAVSNIALQEGANTLKAVAFDELGATASGRRELVVDMDAPTAVIMDSGYFARDQGVGLSWHVASSGEVPKQFCVYWHTNAFTTTNQTTGHSEWSSAMYRIIEMATDGHYFFRVLGRDAAGNVGPLSDMQDYEYDTTPPVMSISYDKSMPAGAGQLTATVTSSENLSRITPLAYALPGMARTDVTSLENVALRTYRATINVPGYLPSGSGSVFLGARDEVGNTFGGSPSGPDLDLDLVGPQSTVSVTPAAPVQVTNTVVASVTFTLDEPARSGDTPGLQYFPPVGAPVGVPLFGAGTNWAGSLTLDPAMGTGDGEFRMLVADEQDNTNEVVGTGRWLEIYNTAEPPALAAPVGVSAMSMSSGIVQVMWFPVEKAEYYLLYREPGATGAPPAVVVSNVNATYVNDLPPVDGDYRYAVAAMRLGVTGTVSSAVVGSSDRTPPNAPTNLTVVLNEYGVSVGWDAPGSGETPFGYYLYRNGTRIGTFTSAGTTLDHPPRGNSEYVVASFDTLGNENPCPSESIDLTVGPVDSLEVIVQHDQAPLLTWSATDAETVGCVIYRDGVNISTSLLAKSGALVDTNYTGRAMVRYTIKAVNASSNESPARAADVYGLTLDMAVNPDTAELPITHYFDRCVVGMENRSADPVDLEAIELRRAFGGTNETVMRNVAVTVGGGTACTEVVAAPSLDGYIASSMRLRVMQDTGDGDVSVIYQRLFDYDSAVIPGEQVTMSITNQLVAGAYNDVFLELHNHAELPLDVVLARNGGATAGDVYVSVVDELGTELRRTDFVGAVTNMKFSPAGEWFIRIAPGDAASLCVSNVLIPVALEDSDSVVLQGGAESVWYALDTVTNLESGPVVASKEFSLTATPYYGTAAVDTNICDSRGVVTITGQALDRDTGMPVTNVPLNVGFALGPYTWYEPVTTDTNGNYVFEYTPMEGLAGVVDIWGAHPDMMDRLAQARLTLVSLFCAPQSGTIRMSKNDNYEFSIELYNPGELSYSNFTCTATAYEWVGSNKVEITSVTGSCESLTGMIVGPRELQRVNLELLTDLSSPSNALVEFVFVSGMGASDIFSIDLVLSEAVPVLDVELPAAGYVEVGINRGELTSREVLLVNRGLNDLKGITVTPPTNVAWMALGIVPDPDGKVRLPDMPVGATQSLNVVFAPPEGTALDYYDDKFQVEGTNYPGVFDVNLYALVTSDQTGSIQFHVRNTMDQALSNASVRVRNMLVGKDLGPFKTDGSGLVTIDNLDEGRWSWTVSASGHGTAAGITQILPGQTVEEAPLLKAQLVTVNFTVVPVPFTDRYEITIEQTFETHVPEPVLVLSPKIQMFTQISPGWRHNFFLTAANHGLISLNDVHIDGMDLGYARVTPLITYLPALRAMQSVQIPCVIEYVSPKDEYEEIIQSRTGTRSAPAARESRTGSISDYANNVDECVNGSPNLFHVAADVTVIRNYIMLRNRVLGGFNCAASGVDWSALEDAHNSIETDEVRALRAAGDATEAAGDIIDTAKQVVSKASPTEIAKLAGCMIGSTAVFTDFYDSKKTRPGGGTYRGSSSGGWGGGFSGAMAGCFAPGTEIALADGAVLPIEKIVVGDRVRAGNEKRTAEVVEVLRRKVQRMVTLSVEARHDAADKRSLELTPDHQVWVDGKGWTAAIRVKTGDWLFGEKGQLLEVKSTAVVKGARSVVTVRLAGDNAMLANGILVHDLCGPPVDTGPALLGKGGQR